ncbi:MAG TPA: aldehyde dehydrogenase (NADP(+)) [Acidimicrobiales bacterium]|nr:aldehyde dehydrogenase (NADP(+)) [Acidimicrobiales bacterium]
MSITSLDARTGEAVAEVAGETDPAEVSAICRRAAAVSAELERLGRHRRAAMLSAMADALEERRSEIVGLADRESALGEARLNGELTRTCFQLRFFAEVIADGSYLEATIDHAGDTAMGPRPDLRRILRPLGPIAVFGASNFPLAFSVPGGDTASALAAGCAVVVKAHDAHPATSLACFEALSEGARRSGVEQPAVSLVFGLAAGVALVGDPAIRAVGFTGSLAGGRHLFELASRRPSPIPFYGELGALNAVVVAPDAAAARGGEIAGGLASSFTLGVGQFCTKPGLVLLPHGPAGDELRDGLAAAVGGLPAGLMLSERIAAAFSSGRAALAAEDGVRVVAEGAAPAAGPGWWGVPLLLEADDPAAIDGALGEECFGPVLAVLRYGDVEELRSLLARLTPALTATVHADPGDDALVAPLLEELSGLAGRLVWNGYPTGVAVAWAMHHGGPYPATTDPLHTSVGATAIRRWLRPVSYQNVPERLLPAELRDEPVAEHRVPRRVDGRLVLPVVPAES